MLIGVYHLKNVLIPENKMPLKLHMQDSIKRTGKDYKDLHLWMNEDYQGMGNGRHRIANIYETMPYVRKRWGEEGVIEFIYHINDDYERSILLKIVKTKPYKILSKIIERILRLR